jgi:hypothetical protein
VTRALDREALRALRGRLWSEAVGAYLRGEEWHLGGEEEALAREIREGFEEEDVLTEKVRDVLACWPGDSKFDDASYAMKSWQLEGSRVVRARLGQLLLKLGYDLADKPRERRLADCLRRLKWNCRIEQHDGIRYRVWYEKGK